MEHQDKIHLLLSLSKVNCKYFKLQVKHKKLYSTYTLNRNSSGLIEKTSEASDQKSSSTFSKQSSKKILDF